MIQRKQTLFLLELLFLGIALLFVPASTIVTPTSSVSVCLLPLGGGFVSTPWHYAAIALNFIALALSLIAIFLYKKRELQMKLCYVILFLWAVLAFVMAFWPFVEKGNDVTGVQHSNAGVVICLFAVAAAFMAARFIRKDIDLLKSADRIR